MNPDKPYNQLPLLPPSQDIETPGILKKVIRATRALAELKGAGKNIPNQSVLINSIALQEAKESSEIENIFTTHDELYRAFEALENNINPHTKEVLKYQDALWYGYNKINEQPLLTTNLFIKLVRIIKENKAGIRNTPGTRIKNQHDEIIYTPPDGEEIIRDLLKNLEDYIHSEDDIDPLIKLAVIHYQFEAIHPFSDGNGRTGRLINVLYLIQQELIELPVIYLSKYLIDHKTAYYNLLKEVTEKAKWNSWIMFMLDAVESMALYTKQKIGDIYQLKDKVGEELKAKTNFYSMELLDVIFQRPYCRNRHLVNAGIAKRKTAGEYLYKMEELGLMKSMKSGRNVYFINKQLLEILKA